MSLCRSYGCRTFVTEQGAYCPECTHLLARMGDLPNGRDDNLRSDGGRPDAGIKRPVCMGVDLAGTPSHEPTEMQAQRRDGEWLWRCQKCSVMIKPTDADPSEAHGEVR